MLWAWTRPALCSKYPGFISAGTTPEGTSDSHPCPMSCTSGSLAGWCLRNGLPLLDHLPPCTVSLEGKAASPSPHGSPSGASRLAGPLTSKATAAIKLISFLIYTRLSLAELWADMIKVCKWCAYVISFNPLMSSCQNKILKKGFEGNHMGIMAFQKRALSTW